MFYPQPVTFIFVLVFVIIIRLWYLSLSYLCICYWGVPEPQVNAVTASIDYIYLDHYQCAAKYHRIIPETFVQGLIRHYLHSSPGISLKA